MPKRSHGETKWRNGTRVVSPEYRAWQAMRNRCLNKNADDYAYYGGRRIKPCVRWSRFENFLADMGRRPSTKHTLERKNGKRGYNKDNCVWATRAQQAQNREYVKLTLLRARAVRVLYTNQFFRQIDLARLFGVSQRTISKVVRGEGWKGDGPVTKHARGGYSRRGPTR